MRLDKDNLSAVTLAQYFVNLAQRQSMRIGYRRGRTYGNGVIPFDTGLLQSSARVVDGGQTLATVTITPPTEFNYAEYLETRRTLSNGKPNRHYGWAVRFSYAFFATALADKLGVDVRVEMEGNL